MNLVGFGKGIVGCLQGCQLIIAGGLLLLSVNKFRAVYGNLFPVPVQAVVTLFIFLI